MQRRRFLAHSLTALSIAQFATAAGTGALPSRKTIRVAFLLGKGANVIDTSGPWEVFQDTTVDGKDPFELYTVAPEKELVRMTGGLEIMPKYTLKDAPQPHVVVVPAQKSHPDALRWLSTVSQGTDVTVSVCTGAFQLARAGLLKGQSATTHHDFFDNFAKEFPDVNLQRGLRFVDNGRIATAGGLTSGIDLALHIVERYFGREAADTTATYMEYTRVQTG
jgi:transcriptional regulator GlxA family with amidase domain